MVKRRRKPLVTQQTLPAFAYMLLGAVMMMTPFIVEHDGFVNDILVASDTLKPPFDKTIILIGEETVDGSIGIILNKPLSDTQRAGLSSFIRDSGIPVSYGGPLEVSEKIFVLEEKKAETDDGPTVYELSNWDQAVNDTPDLLDRIRKSIKKGEQRYRLFTGFTGWGAFQLENEILVKKKWHDLPTTHDIIFQSAPAAKWDALDRQEKAKDSPPVNQS